MARDWERWTDYEAPDQPNRSCPRRVGRDLEIYIDDCDYLLIGAFLDDSQELDICSEGNRNIEVFVDECEPQLIAAFLDNSQGCNYERDLYN
jgi:hypothetical protein